MLCILWRALVFLGWMATYLLSEHQKVFHQAKERDYSFG
jgi:hypothetical protein